MTTDSGFTIELRQQAGYRFVARFDDPAVPPLVTDEPPPLGSNEGPNPSRLLAVAVANCLSASLLFAMRKFRNEPGPLHTRATAQMVRDDHGRLRVGRISVDLHLGVPAARLQQLQRILDQFEEFCVVTQSVRAAVPVDLRIFDSDDVLLKGEAQAAPPP